MINNHLRLLAITLASCLVLLLTACGSSDDDNDEPVNITEEQAQEAMINGIISGFSANIDNIDDNILNSETLSSILQNEDVSSSLPSGTTDSIQQNDSILDFLDFAELLGVDDPDSDLNLLFPSDDLTDEQYAAQINQLMETYFNDPIRVGNTISYTLKGDTVCSAEEGLSQEEITQCLALLENLSFEQNLTSETSGTVAIVYNALMPITLGYAATEVYVEADLGATKTVLEQLEPLMSDTDDPLELPDTMTGKVRLTLAMAADQSTATVKMGITQALEFIGDLNGSSVEMSMAQAPNLLSFSITQAAVEFSMDLNTMSLTMTTEDTSTTPSTTEVMEISTSGMTANITTDDNGNLVMTNTGIDGALSIKVGEDTDNLVEMVNVTLDKFGATITPNGLITFDSAFDMTATLTDVNGDLASLFDGVDLSSPSALSISAPADTEFNFGLLTGGEPQVSTGSITLTGTGGLEGSVTVEAGECFITSQDWLFAAGTCTQASP